MDKAWRDAVATRNLAAIRSLAAAGGHLDSRDEHGQTALMLAARAGDTDVVAVLIGAGAQLDVAAKYGLTALMLAIVNDRRAVALALVRAGADLARRGTGAPGFAGKSARDLAAERGQDAVVAAIDARSAA